MRINREWVAFCMPRWPFERGKLTAYWQFFALLSIEMTTKPLQMTWDRQILNKLDVVCRNFNWNVKQYNIIVWMQLSFSYSDNRVILLISFELFCWHFKCIFLEFKSKQNHYYIRNYRINDFRKQKNYFISWEKVHIS